MAKAANNLVVNLPADIEQKSDLWICQMVRDVVRGNQDRDDDLWRLRQQLEGVGQPWGDGPWPNSCQLQDPVSREFHTTAHANIVSAYQQKPWVTLQALKPQDDPIVQKLETLGNTEADLFGLDKAFNTLAYIMLESRFGVCMVNYATTETKHKELEPLPPAPQTLEDGTIAVQSDITQPSDYQLTQRNDVVEAFEFVPLDPWDFYLGPVGSQKVQEADHTVERLWLTKTALIDGVRNEGFDAEAVKRLLKAGPSAISDNVTPRKDEQELQGVEEEYPGFYECFRVVGRMPYLEDADGEPQTPEQFLGEDFLWMVCPAHSIVFKRTYSPFPVRPYALGKALGPDNEMIGHGVVSMISAIADEMTIILRAIMDSTNATMDPQMKVPEHLLGYYSYKDNRRPGSLLPYRGNDPNSVQAVTRDFAGLELGVSISHDLYQRAAQLAAAQGVNTSMGGKVRKAAEVDFTAQVIQNKFGLMLTNMNKMLEEIFRIYFALRRYHTNDAVSVRTGMTEDEITKDDLEVPFKIIPHANAENASAALREQVDQAVFQICTTSPGYQQKVAMGDFSLDWDMRAMMLSHKGIRNPEAFLGQRPQPFDPVAIIQQIFPIVMQGAQMQDPVALAIVQKVQAMQQQAQMQGGAQAGQPGSNLVPGVGLNMPAMPGSGGDTQMPMSGVGALAGAMGGAPHPMIGGMGAGLGPVPKVSISLKDSPPWAQQEELARAGFYPPPGANGNGVGR